MSLTADTFYDQAADMLADRDRARAAAVALEHENAELLEAARRVILDWRTVTCNAPDVCPCSFGQLHRLVERLTVP